MPQTSTTATATDLGDKTPQADEAITEDEAALYDRQIRLWGLEAQQRMRNATVLVLRLKGVATETIKNIVLAGIGTLIVVDTEDVSAEDLGAGFFFRDEDLGHKASAKSRVNAAKARIEALNPLVKVETHYDHSILQDRPLDDLISGVNLVCATDWDREELIRINNVCRRFSKPFYAGGSYGLLGYIFCDLLKHDYISPDRGGPPNKDSGPAKNVRLTASYAPLEKALRDHRWTGLTRKQTKELNPAAVFSILALWEYQARHDGLLPSDVDKAGEIEAIAADLVTKAQVNRQALPNVPKELVESVAVTASHELSPVCAIVGGMLAQDILKTLGAREAPISNFFTFDGSTGAGTVVKMCME
ncbi:hypothetical protein BDY19DRAFT_997352 [Irpex rosettiformis]|uniref:Uncharacterized protein n=1 Tax=Irpex rosettiformis TaxID=378272 RepID=A0ACB8TRX1_9APHY|nr:hypothetical protein BDY19DRAFT_997352 [Irpex rosettiformis]